MKFLEGILAASLFAASIVGCHKPEILEPDLGSKAVPVTHTISTQGQYIIVLKSSAQTTGSGSFDSMQLAVMKEARDVVIRNLSLDISLKPEDVFGSLEKGFIARLTKEQAALLRKDPLVKSVEEDQLVLFGNGNTSKNTQPPSGTQPAQTTPWGVAAVGGAVDATRKTAWIIDSGIDPSHPDLNVDSRRSRSFLSSAFGGNWSSWADELGHGTMVAGIIGAKNNTIGVVGVAANATLVSLKVISYNGQGYSSGLIQALDYVYSQGRPGDVVNLSIGTTGNSTIDNYVQLVAGKGIYVVMAAGNNNMDCTGISPARVNGTNIFTVSASTSDRYWWSGSNYGLPVDYSAPGSGIYTTAMGGGYATGSGTSFASPHLAGILLARGTVTQNGFVIGDPDTYTDPLCHE